MSQGRFKLREGKVVDEAIDGEVIIIQLERGTYFSLGGSGEEIWELFRSGHDELTAASVMRGRYPDQAEEIGPSIQGLVSRMLEEQVLERDEVPGEATASADDAPREGRFEKPKLERYDDMQDFLLLDPIHEVHETGWPKPGPT
ncbi:PqqD family protein [soil metagenome]